MNLRILGWCNYDWALFCRLTLCVHDEKLRWGGALNSSNTVRGEDCKISSSQTRLLIQTQQLLNNYFINKYKLISVIERGLVLVIISKCLWWGYLVHVHVNKNWEHKKNSHQGHALLIPFFSSSKPAHFDNRERLSSCRYKLMSLMRICFFDILF